MHPSPRSAVSRFSLQVLALAMALCAPMLAQTLSEASVLRVMSYNIHHGEGLDRVVDLGRIARLITEAKVDIVGFQEVDRGVQRTAGRDLPAELAKLTGMTAYFEKNIPYQGGEYGNAVLTRFPIKRARNTHYRMLRPGEQRGVLQLVLDVHGREVLFMNTHLDYRPDDAERRLNVGELREIVAAAGAMPVILVGDFNATPDSRPIVETTSFLVDAWAAVGSGPGFTFPVRQPAKRIDYVFVTSSSLEPLKASVLRSEASDHLPLLVELRLR